MLVFAAFRRALLATPVLPLLLAASCARSAQPTAIELGATLPITGAPALAEAWKRGYERAVEEANAAGGLTLANGLRVPVRLTIRDDGNEMPRAESESEALLAAGVQALLATPGALRMAVQAAVAQRHRRPYVVPRVAGEDLKASDHPWVLVAQTAGDDDETHAYHTARAILEAFTRAPTLEAEAVRRAFDGARVAR